MNRTIIVLWIIVMGVALASPAHAHGEIVYGARYYLPPGASGASHSHIYRIDPDGRHRVQLTFGNSDDSDPVWSDGGRAIQFCREVNPSGDRFVMTMRSDGAAIRKIREINEDDVPFDTGEDAGASLSPDKRYLCKEAGDGNGDDIVETATHQQVGSTRYYGPVLWVDDRTFAGVVSPDWGKTFRYVVYDLNGRQLSTTTLTNVTRQDALEQYAMLWAIEFGDFDAIRPDPAIPGTYLAALDAKRSDMLYWIDPRRKVIRFVTSTYVEAWAPSRQSFCTCQVMGTSRYGPDRYVWTSLLAVVNAKTLAVKILQGGVVDCNGVDWLGGRRLSDDPGR